MYLVFAGDHYYPAGGWGDFEGAFSTFEEAEAHAKSLRGYDWYQIVHGDKIVKEVR